MFSLIKQKWQDIITFMLTQFEISEVAYSAWIEPMYPYDLIEDKLYVVVHEDNDLYKNIDIKNRFDKYIDIAVLNITGLKVRTILILGNETADISNISSSEAPPVHDDFNELIKKNGLNPKFTFKNFVSGKSNELAHAASVAVAENPGKDYKLLYLYGGVGLGKTHLMHAIAIYILKNNPDTKICYTTSENFVNEYVDSLKNKVPESFRNKYRNLDVLLIDDIQFIAGRDSTQEEFFNTFNALYNDNKQIIISSDKPPKDINDLAERIRSRFEGGMIVDIQPPNFDTRMAILRKKEEIEGYNVDDEVIKYIASNIKSNIRTLEGALQRVVLQSKLEKSPITADKAASVLRAVISGENTPEKITIEKILSVVAEHYHISEDDIKSVKKSRNISDPRAVVMYLCSTMTDATEVDIGNLLGRDHSTVNTGKKKITADLEVNEQLRSDIEIIRKKITP